MKWVEIAKTHVNTDQLETFTWIDGCLRLYFHRDRDPVKLADPDKKLYTKLCRSQGIRPVMEAADE